MEIQVQYLRARRDFGRQAGRGWAEPPAELLLDERPSASCASAAPPRRAPRDPASASCQCAPAMAAHSANTVAVTYSHRGASHAEGGWPRDVDPSEPEQTQRCRRKLERDGDFLRAVAQAAGAAAWAAGESEALNPYAEPLAALAQGGSVALTELLQVAARAQRRRDLLKEQRAAAARGGGEGGEDGGRRHKEAGSGGGGGGGGGGGEDDGLAPRDGDSNKNSARGATALASSVRAGGASAAAPHAAGEVPSMYVATLLRDPWAAAAAGGTATAAAAAAAAAAKSGGGRPFFSTSSRRAVVHVAWHQPQQSQQLGAAPSAPGQRQQAAPTLASARRLAVCYRAPPGAAAAADAAACSSSSSSSIGAFSSSASSTTASAALCGYVWDVATPYAPVGQLCPLPGAGGGLLCSAFAPRDAALLACGQANGQAVLFDLRRGPRPFDATPVAAAHRDAVRAVLWLPGRGAGAAGELVTASADGAVAWWDARKLSAPLDALAVPWPAGGGGLAVAAGAAAVGADGLAGGAGDASVAGGLGAASSCGGGAAIAAAASSAGGGAAAANNGPPASLSAPTPCSSTPTLSAVLLDDTAAPQPGRVLVGTQEGAVALCSRRARQPADRVAAVYAAHAGAVTGLMRSPHHPRFFLSCGDWSAKVWAEDHPRAPLLATSPGWRGPGATDSYVSAGCWSQTRPALVYTAGMDGALAAWDLLHSHAEPVSVLQRCLDAPLTALAAHACGGALAAGGECGSVAVVAVGPSLAVAGAGERAEVGALLEREAARERALERTAREQRQKQRQAAARRAAEAAAAAAAAAAVAAAAADGAPEGGNRDADDGDEGDDEDDGYYDAELRAVEDEYAAMTGVKVERYGRGLRAGGRR
jgi:hypothetical protein